MPIYVFRDADGKRYNVEAEDGVSEAQAYELFQKARQPQAGAIGAPGAGKAPQRAPAPGQLTAEASKMAAADMGPWEWGLANVGAGMNKAYEGASQLLGFGPNDAELRETRERDAALADAGTGGTLLQIAGEAAPTLAIPAGGFLRGAQAIGRGGSLLARILSGAAGRAATTALPTVGRLGTAAAAADMALAGAAGGALMPVTSDESRLFNAAAGGAAGAVLPATIAGGRRVVGAFTRSGAEERAAAKIAALLGGDPEAAAVVAKLRGYKPGAYVADIPMSVGEITQNPALAAAERASRARDSAAWTELGQMQAEMRYNALRDATQDAPQLGRLIEQRTAATAPMREKALAAAQADQWFHEPVVKEVTGILARNAKSSDAGKVANMVAGDLADGITPEKLYSTRKTLTAYLDGPTKLGDTMSSNVKAARAETMKLIDAIDAGLNNATKGKWQAYLDKFRGSSKAVDSAEAQALIRDAFEREGSSKIAGASGTVPEITSKNLGTAVERFGSGRFGDKLDYGTRDALNQLIENVQSSEMLQKAMKKAGTSGGGSNTAMDLGLIADQAEGAAAGKLGLLAKGAGFVRNKRKSMTDVVMSDALRNPDEFVRVVEAKLAQNKPLTVAEDFVLNAVRAASAGAMPQLTSQ